MWLLVETRKVVLQKRESKGLEPEVKIISQIENFYIELFFHYLWSTCFPIEAVLKHTPTPIYHNPINRMFFKSPYARLR
jgi:hypothetical protein